ncbi:MAG: GDSL-type esterase/lipase family protein [Planctomycetota bacterium]
MSRTARPTPPKRPTRLRRVLRGLLAGVGLTLGLAAPAPAEAKPLQIMLLGDELTASESGRRSYRYYLWRRLIDAGLDFDFIGTRHTNDGGTAYWPRHEGRRFDPDHEGHAGWRIDHVIQGRDDGRGGLADWLAAYTPDVAVVLLGHVDAKNDQPGEWAQREMRELIEMLRLDNDRLAVLLVCPPPALHEAAGPRLAELAEVYAQIAERENTAQSPVRLVDLHAVLDPHRHLAIDGTQPNDAGERLMAERIAAALLRLDERHLDPVRRTTAQAWGSVLVVPLGAGLGFFLLARAQLRREQATRDYQSPGVSADPAPRPLAGRARRVAAEPDGPAPLTFPGPR